MDGTENEHFRIWDKPFRVMADGVALEVVNDCPNNPHPLSWSSKDELDKKMAEQRAKCWGNIKSGGSGNHMVIQHAGETAQYARMQMDSLSTNLLAQLAAGGTVHVKAGDFLGLAGNSTAPHLHIDSQKALVAPDTLGALRPMVFSGAWAIGSALITGNPQQGLWSPMDGQRASPRAMTFCGRTPACRNGRKW